MKGREGMLTGVSEPLWPVMGSKRVEPVSRNEQMSNLILIVFIILFG